MNLCPVCSKTFARKNSQIGRAKISTCSRACQATIRRIPADPQTIKKMYQHGTTQRQIAAIVGCSQNAISDALRRQGVVCRTTNRKLEWSWPDDSPAWAYWMGFCFADGCAQIRGTTECLTLVLNSRDASHLEAFCAAVGLDGKAIRQWPHSAVGVVLARQGIFRLLLPWGIVPRKSYAENFSEPDMPSTFISHFLRGWFDGDGTLAGRHHSFVKIACNARSGLYLVSLCSRLGIATRLRQRPNQPRVYDLILLIEASRRFHFICNGTPRLERKWMHLDAAYK